MTTTTETILNKEKKLADHLNFHNNRLPNDIELSHLKIFCYELPAVAMLYMNNHYLLNEEIYAEDYGTFLLVLNFLKKFSTPDIGEADFVLFPFNLYARTPLSEQMLVDAMAHVRSVAGNKTVILFSMGDFCLRPGARSTPFEQRLFSSLNDRNEVLPSWIRSSDIVICFESTPDLVHHNICIFPLIALEPTDPFQKEKHWLFSFTGHYYKEGWPEGFVRCPSNKPVWEALAAQYAANALIAEPEKTPAAAGQIPFYEVPARSVFTICPRGIASWSFRTFEAISNGSIPVLLADAYVKPFGAFIPWDHFSVTIPEDQLSQVGDILSAIPAVAIEALKKNLQANQYWFTAPGLLQLITRRLLQFKTIINPI